nr:MAG TPA: hypothetical protein [Caudoviricetes sp.]
MRRERLAHRRRRCKRLLQRNVHLTSPIQPLERIPRETSPRRLSS